MRVPPRIAPRTPRGVCWAARRSHRPGPRRALPFAALFTVFCCLSPRFVFCCSQGGAVQLARGCDGAASIAGQSDPDPFLALLLPVDQRLMPSLAVLQAGAAGRPLIGVMAPVTTRGKKYAVKRPAIRHSVCLISTDSSIAGCLQGVAETPYVTSFVETVRLNHKSRSGPSC